MHNYKYLEMSLRISQEYTEQLVCISVSNQSAFLHFQDPGHLVDGLFNG